jgi:hypothetical protein
MPRQFNNLYGLFLQMIFPFVVAGIAEVGAGNVLNKQQHSPAYEAI